MKRINLLIAALHATALAATPFALGGGAALAQSNDEVRAYMDALSSGTPEALTQFLSAYPNSALPGSELGASIAAKLDQPTASTTTEESTRRDHGWRSSDQGGRPDTVMSRHGSGDGIY